VPERRAGTARTAAASAWKRASAAIFRVADHGPLRPVRGGRGRTAHLTVREQGDSDLRSPRPRHLRLRVIAADRAGNVSERSRLVAVKKA
jgi:hypothetical protein